MLDGVLQGVAPDLGHEEDVRAVVHEVEGWHRDARLLTPLKYARFLEQCNASVRNSALAAARSA